MEIADFTLFELEERSSFMNFLESLCFLASYKRTGVELFAEYSTLSADWEEKDQLEYLAERFDTLEVDNEATYENLHEDFADCVDIDEEEADSDVEFNDEPVLPLRKKSRQTTLKEYFC